MRRPPNRDQRLQQPCGAFGKRGVGGHGGELVLPQIDITPGERGKIGRFRHGAKYTGAPDRGASIPLPAAVRAVTLEPSATTGYAGFVMRQRKLP